MSQEQRVLQMLQKRPKWGVKNYEFTDANILRYSARIGELRKTHHITCERLYKDGKATSVFVYRLVVPEQPNYDKSRQVDGMRYEHTGSILDKLRKGIGRLKK